MIFSICPPVPAESGSKCGIFEFLEKILKKVLTNGGGFGILAKLSARETGKSFLKDGGLEKNPKKVLDKRFCVCYDSKAVTPKHKAVLMRH